MMRNSFHLAKLPVIGQRVAAICALTLLALLLVAPAALGQGGVVVRLETTPASGSAGDLFTSTVTIEGVTTPGMGGWSAYIDYDPALVKVNLIGSPPRPNVTHINVWQGIPGCSFTFPFTANNPGRLYVGATAACPSGPTGDLAVVEIVWEALASGSATLDLNGSIVSDVTIQRFTIEQEIDSQITITPSCYDFNGDNLVNIKDVMIVAANWGSANLQYDLNGDQMVDAQDIALAASQWNTVCPS